MEINELLQKGKIEVLFLHIYVMKRKDNARQAVDGGGTHDCLSKKQTLR